MAASVLQEQIIHVPGCLIQYGTAQWNATDTTAAIPVKMRQVLAVVCTPAKGSLVADLPYWNDTLTGGMFQVGNDGVINLIRDSTTSNAMFSYLIIGL